MKTFSWLAPRRTLQSADRSKGKSRCAAEGASLRRRIVRTLRFAAAAVLLLAALSARSAMAAQCTGRVVDGLDQKPIADAIITAEDTVVRTGRDGIFHIDASGDYVGVRAYGYLRTQVPLSQFGGGAVPDIALKWFRPKAVYLSFFGVGHRALREAALKLINQTELNAVVIDVKGDRGLIAYRSSIPLAAQIGAQEIVTIPDIKALLATFHERGIYTIARIVVFKDAPLALSRPGFAVRTASGAVFRDREHLAWTNPYIREVRDYNVAVAVEAARNGFDEIQFDYLRLPDVRGGRLAMPGPYTEKDRVAPINAFLAEARKALTPYNVFIAADIFGYVCWNLDDTHIGQKLGDIAGLVDYISPMLYPSGFQFGIPGYRNPVRHVREVVHLSLDRAQQRTGLPPVRFRPWLQAFRDYAFGGLAFDFDEIRAQIDAAEEFGSDGWMLWNPNNRYYEGGLKYGDGEAARPQ